MYTRSREAFSVSSITVCLTLVKRMFEIRKARAARFSHCSHSVDRTSIGVHD